MQDETRQEGALCIVCDLTRLPIGRVVVIADEGPVGAADAAGCVLIFQEGALMAVGAVHQVGIPQPIEDPSWDIDPLRRIAQTAAYRGIVQHQLLVR
jgi:hypothetical protein